MTLADIKNRIFFLTNTDATSYTYANMTINLNKAYDDVFSAILRAQTDWQIDDSNNTDLPFATTSLVASQQDYSLPTTLMTVKRIEITYDGTIWHKAQPLDIGSSQNATDTTSLTNDFSTEYPKYDLVGRSIMLYPIPSADSTNGLKIWYDRAFTLFSYTSEASNDILTGTKTPGFDRQYHDLLALSASFDWLMSKDVQRAGNVKVRMDEMYQSLAEFYSSRQQESNIVLTPAIGNYE